MSAKPKNAKQPKAAMPKVQNPTKKKPKKTKLQKQIARSKQRAISLTTPVGALQPAAGVLNVINVDVSFDATSFQCIPLALITAALVKGATDPYAIYLVFYADIQSLASGGNGTAPVRLTFYNCILAALVPKTVPMGSTGVISYNVNPTPSITPPLNSINLSGGYIYYMYVPGGTPYVGWATQKTAPGYSPEIASQLYVAALNKLSRKTPHLIVARDIQLQDQYLHDISGFVRNSPYFGQGCSQAGSPFSSTEGEVNYKSLFFGVLVPFQALMPRSSRVLHYTTGDSISNFGIGLWPDFPTEYYQGAMTPIYKFLDIDELIFSLMQIWFDAVSQYCNDHPTVNDTLSYLLAGMQVPWSLFRIAIRQQILWMNADSQMLGQSISPETGSGGFQPFLCGSNCYPANPASLIQLPGSLVENLRMLRRCNFPYHTKYYDTPRNRIIIIPVWGAFQNTVAINTFVEFGGDPFYMFTPEPSEVPSIFDGTLGTYVADFNATELVQGAIATWNEFMDITKQYMLGSTQLGGAVEPGSLLQFTRYVTFTNISARENHQAPRVSFKRPPRCLRQYIQQVERKTSVLEKKSSKAKLESVEKVEIVQVYNPPDSTIFAEYTTAISGQITISEPHRQMFPQLILPVIELVPGALPTQSQYQTAVKELYSFTVPTAATNIINSRATELDSGLPNNVKGNAGEPTEWANYVANKSKMDQGGFLGNLFTTIGSVASVFCPEVGTVVSGIGNVANAFDL